MKTFGLIGLPIGHSKSPALFAAAYGGRYPYNLIDAPDFPSSYRTFMESYDGINVTSPYKGEACASASQLTNGCIVSGSANTLLKTRTGVKAWNTDIDGARGCLKELFEQKVTDGSRAEWKDGTCGEGRTALVIGCGGAGKSAALAALMEGFRLIIMNRTVLKAENFARKLTVLGKGPADKISAAGLEKFKETSSQADVLIYTLPVRIPELEDLPDQTGRPEAVIEANYRDPAFSGTLAQELIAGGVRICPGERWLLHQASAAYRIFTGEEPDIAAMDKVL